MGPFLFNLILSCSSFHFIQSCALINFCEKLWPVRLLDPVHLLIFDKFHRENGLGPTRICTGPGPTGIYTGMGPTVSYTGPGPTTF